MRELITNKCVLVTMQNHAKSFVTILLVALVLSSLESIVAKSTKSNNSSSKDSSTKSKEVKSTQQQSTSSKILDDEIEVIHGDEETLQQKSKHQKEKELYFLRGRYYELLYEKSKELKNKTKHGFFIGVALGTSQLEINKNQSQQTDINPLAFGLTLGYLRYLEAAQMGVRIYGQYLGALNASPSVKDKVDSHLVSFNVDLIGEKAIGNEEGYYLGVFAGMGAGINFYQQKSHQQIRKINIGPVLNFGVSATLKYHHRLELGIKIPPSVSNESYSLGAMFFASHQYLF